MALRIAPTDALVNGVINAESSGNPNAVSPAGALGLMQIMPTTGAMYGASPTDLMNPDTNRRVGMEYLTYLLNKYGGDQYKALVAYNEGPGKLDKGVYYPESVNYAHKVLGNEKLPPTSITQDSDTPPPPNKWQPPTNWSAQMPDPTQIQSAAQTSPQPVAAPAQTQPTGVMGGIEGLLGHPLVQAALAAYLGAISSPRRLGWGGAIGRGGLAGLGQFSQAEQLQNQLPLQQAQTQEAQAKAAGEIAKQRDITALPQQERAYAEMGVLPQYMTQSNIRMGNQGAVGQFLLGHPNDPIAQQIGNAALNAPTYVGNELEKQYQAAKLFPLKQQETQTNIKKGQAEATKATVEAGSAGQPKAPGAYQAGGREMVWNPTTRSYQDAGASSSALPKKVSELDLEKQASSEAEAAYKATQNQHWFKSRMPDHDSFVEQYRTKRLQELRSDAGQGGAPAKGKSKAATPLGRVMEDSGASD